MIYGTGLDIVEIKRIKKSLEKYSPRFENKVFTDTEIDYCQTYRGLEANSLFKELLHFIPGFSHGL